MSQKSSRLRLHPGTAVAEAGAVLVEARARTQSCAHIRLMTEILHDLRYKNTFVYTHINSMGIMVMESVYIYMYIHA